MADLKIAYKPLHKVKLAKGSFEEFKKFFKSAVEKFPDYDWEKEFKAIGGVIPPKRSFKKDED